MKAIRSWWTNFEAGYPIETRPSSLADRMSEALITEAEAVIGGRHAEQLLSRGRSVPPWAWLNALAHRPPDEVSAIAAVSTDSWGRAAFEIATTLQHTPADKAADIASTLFVPLELNALSGQKIPGGPSQVVRALERRLNA